MSFFNIKGEFIYISYIMDFLFIDDVSFIYICYYWFFLLDFKMFNWFKGGEVKGLIRLEKVCFLVKSLVERFVKSVLYVEFMDNIIVFVVFLFGFFMVNW